MHLLKTIEEKTCSKCREIKPLSMFCKNKKIKGGFNIWCRGCAAINAKNWRVSNPEKWESSRLTQRFGISLGDYNSMFAAQNGCCAICNRHQSEFKRALAVDHNHETGEVRSLLCGCCNTMLGNAMEKPEVLKLGAAYLEGFMGANK